MDSKDDGAPKRIGAAERETRMTTIRAELGGISVADGYEPSHTHCLKLARFIKPTRSSAWSLQLVRQGARKSEVAARQKSWFSKAAH